MRRLRCWLNDHPWKRRALWLLGIMFGFVVFPGIIGVVAGAQTSSGVSQIDGLSWMNVRDSNGVPLASYQFVTDPGSLFNPGNTVLWAILGILFVGYMAIVTSAIWAVTFTFSFTWLDMFAAALTGTAQTLARQIATPIVLITAATIGAFFVAWFTVRGFHVKATMQVVTMIGVAILGPLLLANPLEDVLSSDGLLTQGRDVGLSVAAGLNGNGNPNPEQLVTIMQHDLADNFARKPVQVWNFGHIIDRTGCESAWTAGVMAGDPDDIRSAVEGCDSAAHSRAENPTFGQIGTGLILLVCATLLMLFAVYLGLKVTKAALDAIYHGFMAIFGFAAGGFVYGPTQTFLVRNIVDTFLAAARMAAFTVFLGVYVLFMGDLFQQAGDQVMSVIVIACAVELVAILQLRRLSGSLDRGNNWVANRFALAIQGGGGGSGGSGGGSALGMGGAQLPGGGGGGMGGLAALAALNTVNSSPLVAWLALRTPNPLNPLARRKKISDLANYHTADSRMEMYEWSQLGRNNWRNKAIVRAAPHGGVTNAIGLANALDGLGDSRVPDANRAPILLSLGANDVAVHQAERAVAVQAASMSKNPFGFAPLQKAVAAARAVENHLEGQTPEARAAFAAQAEIAATNFLRHTNRPAPGAEINQRFVNRVRQNWDSDLALRNAISPRQWNQIDRNTRFAIGHEVAEAQLAAAERYRINPTAANRAELMRWTNRIASLDHMDPNMGLDPWDP
ncbi:hypothetical protein [Nocardia flavorosea]|uniref:Uncharacterized protein n=1 Tax=Nocardia flavorosea TaxID=53429 RepID=A0A846YQL7_9NOCA|nr:hypothetical protein [Nocardia flavorosea]NKY59814.1 hypothetical protein [Nocardia flavorosea]